MGAATIVPAVLGAAGLYQQGRAQKQLKSSLKPSENLARQQQSLLDFIIPYWEQLVGAGAEFAGLPTQGIAGNQGVPQPALRAPGFGTATRFQGAAQPPALPARRDVATILPIPGQPAGPPALPSRTSLPGVFGMPESQLRFNQAEEQLLGQSTQIGNQALGQLNRQGINQSSVAAGIIRDINRSYQRDLANTLRGLQIEEPQEAERRRQGFFNYLAPGFGAAPTILGASQGAQNIFAGQAAQGGQALGQALQAWLLTQQLKRLPVPGGK